MDLHAPAFDQPKADMSPGSQQTKAAPARDPKRFGARLLSAVKDPANWRYPLLLAIFCSAAGWVMTRQFVVLIPAALAFLAAYGLNVLREENFAPKSGARPAKD